MKRYWIVPVLVCCQAEELEGVKASISKGLTGHFHKHTLAHELNPEWMNAENSPIKEITEADYAMIKVGPEPKETK